MNLINIIMKSNKFNIGDKVCHVTDEYCNRDGVIVDCLYYMRDDSWLYKVSVGFSREESYHNEDELILIEK